MPNKKSDRGGLKNAPFIEEQGEKPEKIRGVV